MRHRPDSRTCLRHHLRMPVLRALSLRTVPLLLALLLLLLPAWAAAQSAAAPAAPASAAAATGQETAPAVMPGTGDAWVDQHLADMGSYAQRYPDSFMDEVARYAGVRRGYVQALLQVHGWHAGTSISRVSGRRRCSCPAATPCALSAATITTAGRV